MDSVLQAETKSKKIAQRRKAAVGENLARDKGNCRKKDNLFFHSYLYSKARTGTRLE